MAEASAADTPGAAGRPLWLYLLLAAAVLVADQVTKWMVVAGLFGLPFAGSTLFTLPRPFPVEVTGFFNWVLVGNTGVSFGLFRGAGARWFLVALSSGIVIAMLIWLWRRPEPLVRTGIGLVVGGAIGNIVDRVRLGAVVDFLDFHAFGIHWPAFNLADTAVVSGVGLLLLDGVLGRKPVSS